MSNCLNWWLTSNQRGIQLDVYKSEVGRSYYILRNVNAWRERVLLEFDIDASGRRIDYLRLDRYWGKVARPILG
jgi:hypothetical protein